MVVTNVDMLLYGDCACCQMSGLSFCMVVTNVDMLLCGGCVCCPMGGLSFSWW